MARSSSPLAPSVSPAFRVGITGTRVLAAAAVGALEGQISALLRRVGGALPEGALLRAVSPLAEGADRVLAAAALALGWKLVAPLPFAVEEYETDFPATVDRFRALLGQAEVIALDGGRGQANASYEAVGRFVVRNCDLLIVVWDGHTNNGRGGTAEIARFAAHAEVPIWWLMPDGVSPPRLVRRAAALAHGDLAPAGAAAEAALDDLLRRCVTPPAAPPPERAGSIGFVISTGCRMAGRAEDPLADYLAETARRDRLAWRLYDGFMDWIAPAAAGETVPAEEGGAGTVEAYWTRLQAPADALSNAYGQRYRSCYLWVFLLATLAVTSAVLGFAFPATLERWMTPAEGVFLLGILGVVGSNHLRRFHERWISYRLLAELCRKQLVLATLGWSLPHWEVERLTRDEAGETVEPPRETWVAWYFSAACRAAPLPAGQLGATETQLALALGRSLAAEQILYHRAREQRSDRAGQWLVAASDVAFFATLVLVGAKLAMAFWWPGLADGLVGRMVGALCLVTPAVSAALVGIRAYAEFEVLAHQSARMRREIGEIAMLLQRPLGAEALDSQRVAGLLMELSMAMLRELRGWAQLFRVKPVESG